MNAADGFSGLSAHKGRPLLERLMVRVIPVPYSGCWLWTGGLYNTGYGMAFLPGGKPILAHGAMIVAQGQELSSEDVVCHHCDVKCCINPDHLFIATQTENLADMTNKGRRRSWQHKIPTEYRNMIKNEDRYIPVWAIAMWFGVSEKTIRNIRNGAST